ncbi:serine hydrolase domain-containing protein [Kutzneria viridogrisea]|uniref:CubicO group peptidase (Beta-lactamase class C family) n=1 Tax=Kutzneria viridogrisea TaxID=47990 RepID=A0ABR6BPA4_9PSEU|nr:CubicO group peptidase (beta-lactamase class C family) [Kutzneria viridogrisea]
MSVQDTIDELVAEGVETGVQVAVYEHGELVVDAVAGLADPATGRAMTPDTPIFSTSTGKGMTATVLHILVQRGVFGYDTPVTELWPEFGAHGKQAATVRHVLTHAVGVPGLPADTTPEDLADWARMCEVLADAEPWWEPGTRTGYHAITFGYLAGELVRRGTGKPIDQVLLEEVAAPLGLSQELYFAVPPAEQARLARLVPGGPPMDEATIRQLTEAMPLLFKAAPPALQPSAELYNRTDFLSANVPAGGTVTARGIARMYAAPLGEVDGVRLLTPETLDLVSAVAIEGTDQVFGNPARLALGYAVIGGALGWSGANGSHAEFDPATGRTFAVTKNRFGAGDFNTVERVRAALAG